MAVAGLSAWHETYKKQTADLNSVLVTGATGFLGRRLVSKLLQQGKRVHALYRSQEKIEGWEHENLEFFKGSIRDARSIESAMKGCRKAYHLAACASAWQKNFGDYYEDNVGGTVNVLESALGMGLEKLVVTSTAGVLGPSGKGVNTEDKQHKGKQMTHYDRSKAEAENRVMQFVEKGLNAVVINPTRIFGPGELRESNALTMIIGRYLNGTWKIIPGDGSCIGNYVYVDDVADCHLLAMEKGKAGHRYLAGGENLSFNDMLEALVRVTGIRRKLHRVPMQQLMIIAGGYTAFSHITGRTPPVTPAFVRKYLRHWAVSSEKARTQLGYRPMSFEQGLKKTIEWIQTENIL